MKNFKWILRFFVVCVVAGAAVCMYLDSKKEKYIRIDSQNSKLY